MTLPIRRIIRSPAWFTLSGGYTWHRGRAALVHHLPSRPLREAAIWSAVTLLRPTSASGQTGQPARPWGGVPMRPESPADHRRRDCSSAVQNRDLPTEIDEVASSICDRPQGSGRARRGRSMAVRLGSAFLALPGKLDVDLAPEKLGIRLFAVPCG